MRVFLRRRWMVHARRHPSAWLLLAQLLGLLLYPALDGIAWGSVLLSVFGMGVLALALWVVNRSPVLNWIAWCLAVPAAVLILLAVGFWDGRLLAIGLVLEGALYLYTALGLIAYMLQDHEVTSDELFAAGATFTLLAWAFAFAFSVCQIWYPGSFTAALHPETQRSWMELLSLSFSMLSGVGLSDIMPVRPQARALVMLAQFVGVMYIALVVSRLIGLSILRQTRRPS
ncbi:ion channel [Pseudoxanthomonas suwonensis]|uniref:Ion channel n=1 Tax=Pseudoxanthomonas suwonensis TaxID=314722 RepID=A0A0E3Z001_9GAMM|nr:ion channel [Pseudoxanthomonas suwonensis]AKC86239.1 Ion channel [Pseudoxanthomonas suwonensis]